MKYHLKSLQLLIVGFLLVFSGGTYADNEAPGSLLFVNSTALKKSSSIISMAVNPVSQDVYVAIIDGGDSISSLYSTVLIMRPDAVTGSLTQIRMIYKVQGLTWITQIKVDPTGKFVYFYGRTDGGGGAALSIYSIADDILSYKNTVAMTVGDIFNCCPQTYTGIDLSPDGRFIYSYYPVKSLEFAHVAMALTAYTVSPAGEIASLDSQVLPYFINPNSSPITTLNTLVTSNQYVYAQHMDGSGVSTYSNSNGKLTLVSDGANVNVKKRALAMALEPTGKMLYSVALLENKIKIVVHGVTQDGKLEILNVVDGINAGGTPFDMLIDPSGRYLYILQSEGIAMYRIGASGSILKPIGIQPTYKNGAKWGESPGFFAIDKSGKFLYTVGLSDKPMLNTYKVAQITPEMQQRISVGRNPSGLNWKRISDTTGLTDKCDLSVACNLPFSASIQSTRIHLIANDAKNSELSFTVKTDINNAGFDQLNVSECSAPGSLNTLCSNMVINPAMPWIIDIPPPNLSSTRKN